MQSDNGEESTKKRTLGIKACAFCKKRHLRCDGMSPCSQCNIRKGECLYEEPRKRGRKKGAISSVDLDYNSL